MSNLNYMGNFWRNKSIKLSDAFSVFFNENNANYMVECTGVTLPTLEYTEETQTYGNVSQTFLIPNYESASQLSLEFYETVNGKIFKLLKDLSNWDLEDKYDKNGLATFNGEYHYFVEREDGTSYENVLKSVTIKIADNRFKKYIYEYYFTNLKVIDYTLYDLDYSNDSPCKISINFSFEGYGMHIINEPITYNK